MGILPPRHASMTARSVATVAARGGPMKRVVFATLMMLTVGPALAQPAPVAITVDLGKPVGPYKPIYAWFGYDEANFSTAEGGKKLLRELHDLSPVPVHIRA